MSKISELSDGGSIQSGDTLIAVRSGGNVKVTYGGTTTANIDGGTIDGTVIGGSSAAAGTFTSITGTSANINGTVTADGAVIQGTGSQALTVNSSTGNSVASFTSTDSQAYISYLDDSTTGVNYVATGAQGNDLVMLAGAGVRAKLFNNGDFQLYEDTATTAKFFWDASAESLGIGTTSPQSFTSLQVKTATDRNFAVFDNAAGVTLGGLTDAGASAALRIAGQNVVFTGAGGSGSEHMRIDASGNVGIGTTSPASKLAVNGTATFVDGADTRVGTIKFDSGAFQIGTSASEVLINGQTFLGLQTAGTERMRIDSSGNVGIGTTSPSYKLHISDTAVGSAVWANVNNTDATTAGATAGFFGSNGTVNSVLYSAGNALVGATGTTSNHPFIFLTNGSERMRIDSSGNLLVGKTTTATLATDTTAGSTLYGIGIARHVASSSPSLQLTRTSTDGDIAVFTKDGTTVGSISVTASTTAYNITSDERLKENIVDTTHTVDINDIKVRQYDWKSNGEHQRYGFIAQELEAVYPEAVFSPEDPEEMKAVDYSKLVPLLVKEIQDLKAEVAALKGA